MKSAAPQARRRPPRPAALIALGLLGIAVFVVATLPASLVVNQFARFGIQADAVGGTIWSGRAQGVTARGTLVGDAQWSLRPLALLRGALAGHALLVQRDGRVEADFVRSWSGRLELAQARADIPLSALAALRLPIRGEWRGQVVADLPGVVVEGNWPVSATGIVELRELVAPPPRNAALGSFRLAFQDAAPAGSLRALVTQTEGPLQLDGTLVLGADRSFLLDGRLAPRSVPVARARVATAGARAARGRRPASLQRIRNALAG